MAQLKESWKAVEDAYIRTKKYFFLSPSHYSLYYYLIPIFKRYIKGCVLDVGAGRLGWKFLIEKFAIKYFSCDVRLGNKGLSFISDGRKIPANDETFDAVTCLQVLEHTPSPGAVLTEISRVLKKNGYAIASFPHMSYLHGEPEDFFRYTIYGFLSLCPAGLKMEMFSEMGALLSFVATPFFIFTHLLFHRSPGLRKALYYLLAIGTLLVFHIDNILGIKKLYPLNYVVILKKE